MPTHSLELYLPVLVPMHGIDQETIPWYGRIKKEVRQIVERTIFLHFDGLSDRITLRSFEEDDRWPAFVSRPIGDMTYRSFELFRVTTTIDPSVVEIDDETIKQEPDSKSRLMQFGLHTIVAEFKKRICDLILFANLAKPGCLQVKEGYILIDGRVFGNTQAFHNDFILSYRAAQKYNWPPIQELGLAEVVTWGNAVPGFEKGIATMGVGRAIGAFSYLIKPTLQADQTTDILWALLGLEALYAKGNLGLRAQLQEKAETFLGPPPSHKKRFGKAYDFRSRFVHGDVDFPIRHSPYDGTDEYMRFLHDRFEHEDLCIATLIGTLQKMCRENRYELNFKHTLVDARQAAETTGHH